MSRFMIIYEHQNTRVIHANAFLTFIQNSHSMNSTTSNLNNILVTQTFRKSIVKVSFESRQFYHLILGEF